MNTNEPILLCWHSANHGLPVLENAIKALRNRKVNVSKVFYLMQASQRVALGQSVEGVPVETISIRMEDPTHHESIYRNLHEGVLPRLKSVRELHINVSPGTPAMHAVWMVLHAGGALPEGTRLWSSQFNPVTNRTRIDEVDFSISTYLSEIRRLARLKPDLAVYEPEAKSSARREAFERLRRYACIADAPLLLLGERGTGKTRLVETFVAKLKHRRNVVTVPCGGLDSALAESALFGHRKGAFTGAVTDRAGFLKQADRGILFLDEVQDLPQTVQRKLVRTLQDRSRRFRPVGSDEETSAEFDLVCASNLPLSRLRERLDADFFDRLSHLTVTVPPLRDCREDLQDDWQRVWSELRAESRLGKDAPWHPNLSQALSTNILSGNLRDLQRLALLIMAWSDGGSTERTVQSALTEWLVPSLQAEDATAGLGEGTRRERMKWFCAQVARWAKNRYGSWKSAALHLECDEKTLRTDADQIAQD
jgi:DNA-binding NtrC family response regulator